ncbi:DUF1127 domain-containing protein [Paracoccus aestuariivivens]|uniref:DUF1127 domain-containing protein n=1 Tax=Paracoccus aestuariivivens TaxID=1820333 RepID=A0A6L6J720_9RHOB|nr:DUF1127 domain-containing protein [Paracoccus aestuariivivens]MTH76427.1 DUF1127 domain-containing protein [Paracoccus aestuariivivens]
MAIQTTEFAPTLRDRVDAIFARIGQGMNSYVEARSRHREIEALEAMSDKDLADMGITRDRIVHYVFRDLVWL